MPTSDPVKARSSAGQERVGLRNFGRSYDRERLVRNRSTVDSVQLILANSHARAYRVTASPSRRKVRGKSRRGRICAAFSLLACRPFDAAAGDAKQPRRWLPVPGDSLSRPGLRNRKSTTAAASNSPGSRPGPGRMNYLRWARFAGDDRTTCVRPLLP